MEREFQRSLRISFSLSRLDTCFCIGAETKKVNGTHPRPLPNLALAHLPALLHNRRFHFILVFNMAKHDEAISWNDTIHMTDSSVHFPSVVSHIITPVDTRVAVKDL